MRRLKPRHNRFYLLGLMLLSMVSVSPEVTLADDSKILEQRVLYKQALIHLSKGQTTKFNQIERKLGDYPLVDYLSFHKFNRLLHKRSSKDMNEFRDRHSHLPVTEITKKRWLKLIGQRRLWKTFLSNYEESADPKLQCLYARSLYGTGQKNKSFEFAKDLWTNSTSQSKLCDPLFEIWKKTSHFSQEIVWSRLKLTIGENQRQLSRYLLRYLTGTNRRIGQLLYSIHINPDRLAQFKSVKASEDKERDLIIYGLSKLSIKNPDKAAKVWIKLSPRYAFNDTEKAKVRSILTVGRAKKGQFPESEELTNLDTNEEFLTSMANAAILNFNWSEIIYWVQKAKQSEENIRWDYWIARAKIESDDTDDGLSRLKAIADQRHYYGFLAANILNQPPSLNDASQKTPTFTLPDNLRIRRIKELFAVGDQINARREWYKILAELPEKEKIDAIYFISHIGKIPLTIRTANRAGASDHLRIRFPLLYQQEFRQASLMTNLPLPFLYSVARQESAFDARAVSSANARGLMQLLPTTAKEVARRAGLSSPSVPSLHQPALNIKLGSTHLASLNRRYKGQTPLMIAAYNAGERRVDRWTKGKIGQPMDVWIEQIPYKETRNYVKNVMAFRQVYNYLLGTSEPILDERTQYLR